MSARIERYRTRLGLFEARWEGEKLAHLYLHQHPDDSTHDNTELGRKLTAHLSGKPQDFRDLPLKTDGLSDFSQQVYRAAQAIPSGHTLTYLELAKKLGKPGAVRAVGGALGKNPFLLVVPCHRILAAGGKLGGFSAPGGGDTKQLLLAAEGWRTESLFDPGQMSEGEAFLRSCPKLGPIVERVGPCPLQPLYPGSPFAALARAVLYQQLAGSAARAIENRVKKLGSEPFPTAGELSEMPFDCLRGAGVSGPKIATLKALAQAVIEGDLQPDILHLLPDAQVEHEVSQVKGLGPWSAQMFLMFHLGRRDVFPVKDLGIRKGVQLLTGTSELPGPEPMHKLAKRWAPYRTLASWYLWRSLEI